MFNKYLLLRTARGFKSSRSPKWWWELLRTGLRSLVTSHPECGAARLSTCHGVCLFLSLAWPYRPSP